MTGKDIGGKNLKVGLPHPEAEWKRMKDSRSNFWKIFEKWNALLSIYSDSCFWVPCTNILTYLLCFQV